MTKIAINGFGRIGRLTYRRLVNQPGVDIVAINDLTSIDMLAHLLKYDSAHGQFDKNVTIQGDSLIVGGDKLSCFSERDPAKLPWAELEIDVVLECTGIFRTEDTASMHIRAGAKKVLLSAPAKGGNVKTIVIGVNDHEISDGIKIYSNASCTTNCFAPMVKLLDEKWGLIEGYMTTIHSYTAGQNIQDGPHKDMRRARAGAYNIVPTTTGAAKATRLVYPAIEKKIKAKAVRVPVITGSLVDLTVRLKSSVTAEDVNQLFKEASEGAFKGIIQYVEDPIVSSDIIGNNYSNIFDSLLTHTKGDMISIVSWYDNEAGYSSRLADLALRI